jgi:ADP-ribose pyrophosphatase YjhB (NUDIX family)
MTIDPYLRVGALIRNARGALLVVSHGGGAARFWTSPGGLVKEGESLSYALRRSVSEETGVQIRIGDVACIGEVTLARSERRRIEVYFWAVACGAHDPAPSAAWLAVADLGRRFLPSAVLEVAARGGRGSYLGNITDRERSLPAWETRSRRSGTIPVSVAALPRA